MKTAVKTATSKVVIASDTERLRVVDHGEIGLAVIREDCAFVRGRRKYTAVEECLIPREHVPQLAHVMLTMIGAINIDWEI